MNIIFFGSDNLAASHLAALLNSAHKVQAVVTSTDKPKGRGLEVGISEVKYLAIKHHIPVFQPENLRDAHFTEEIRAFHCDLFVVIAYGKILPAELLSLPDICALNLHASLLPKYRGAAPINWAIINGEAATGLTIIKMNAQLDAGDIMGQLKIKIDSEDTAVTLKAKMAQYGPAFFLKTIDSLEENTYTLTIQDQNLVSWAPKLTKAFGCVPWDKEAAFIYNLIRGLLPWPGAYTFYQGKLLKILSAQMSQKSFSSVDPGQVIDVSPKGFLVVCGVGSLLIQQVHLESSKPMSAWTFIQGYRLGVGDKLRYARTS